MYAATGLSAAPRSLPNRRLAEGRLLHNQATLLQSGMTALGILLPPLIRMAERKTGSPARHDSSIRPGTWP